MATVEDIEVTISLKDNVSPGLSSVKSKFGTLKSAATGFVSGVANSLNAVEGASIAALGNLTGKTSNELIMGTSKTAEVNKVLIKGMGDTAAQAESMYNTIDKVTDNHLTSMQSLIPAMNAFKSATGASGATMEANAGKIASFGDNVLALTGSEERVQTAMEDLGKGIKGQFAALDQYGVSEDALMRTGLWSGKEDDVNGYLAAVEEVAGANEDMMDTFQGIEAKVGKAFSRSGKQIGNDLLPFLKQGAQGFLALDEATGGFLTKSILMGTEIISLGSQALGTFSQMASGVKALKEGWEQAKASIETYKNAQETIKNGSEIASDVTGTASKTTKGAEAGASIGGAGAEAGLSAFEQMKKDNVKYRKEAGDLLSDLENTGEINNKVQNTSKKVYSPNAWKNPESLKAMSSDRWDSNIINRIHEYQANQEKVAGEMKKAGETSKKVETAGKDMKKGQKAMKGVGEAANMVPEGTASKIEKSSKSAGKMSGAFSGFGSSVMSMLAPILQVAVVIAIIIPVITALVAEALVFARLIAELVKSLGFDKIDLSGSVNGLKQIGTAVWELAKVIGAMTIVSAVSIVSAGFNAIGIGLGTIAASANSIKATVPIINSLGSMPAINQDAVAKLKSLGEGLKGLSTAVGSMNSTSMDVWTGGFINYITGGSLNKLKEAHDDLVKAVPIINSFSDLPEINQDASKRLKDLGDAMKNVSSAMKSLGSVNIDTAWNGGKFSVLGLKAAHANLKSAAKEINKFSDLPTITPVGPKLVPLANAMKPIKTAVQSVAKNGNLPEMGQLNGVDSKISTVRTVLKPVGEQINKLSTELPVITPVGSKLVPLANAMKALKTTVTGVASSGNFSVEGLSTVSTKVEQARNYLKPIADRVLTLANLPTITQVGPKLVPLANAVKNLSTTVTGVNNVPVINPQSSVNVHNAVENVKKIINELKGLNGQSVGNISGVLSQVRNAMKQITNIVRANAVTARASGVSVGQGIKNGIRSGMNGLGSAVSSNVRSAMSQAKSVAISGARTMGTEATNGFKYTFKIANIAKQEMSYAVQAVNNGSGALADACRRAAQNAVDAAKEGADSHSPGAIARMWGKEIGVYSVEKVNSGAKALINAVKNISRNVVNAWGNPSLTADLGLQKNIDPNMVTGLNTMVNTTPTMGGGNSKIVIMNFNEGAIPIDARNKTSREAKQMLLLALEGLEPINNPNIRGV
ncbi:hypothetical protein [uncultured Methanobrevibacter sp.]|uniref:hypothetical protein n=1 Tax=uncultured Methanobrevibacter sp. TaxID=253161 RepID=UPI002612A0AA|nr:hypothetical protein [uncultured Methanobrevibacter sp.]